MWIFLQTSENGNGCGQGTSDGNRARPANQEEREQKVVSLKKHARPGGTAWPTAGAKMYFLFKRSSRCNPLSRTEVPGIGSSLRRQRGRQAAHAAHTFRHSRLLPNRCVHHFGNFCHCSFSVVCPICGTSEHCPRGVLLQGGRDALGCAKQCSKLALEASGGGDCRYPVHGRAEGDAPTAPQIMRPEIDPRRCTEMRSSDVGASSYLHDAMTS